MEIIKNDMFSRTELLSPNDAKEYLAKSKGNPRYINEDKFNVKQVRKYVSDIENDRWQLTHQGIAFNESGELIDGHHRLRAIIMANKSVPVYVTYNVPNKTKIIDNGLKRTEQQIISLTDVDMVVSRSAVLSAFNIDALCRGENDKAISSYSTLDKYGFLKENEGYLKRAYYCSASMGGQGVRRLTENSYCVYSAFCALKCGVDDEKVKAFFRVVNSGFASNATENSAIVLRNYLLDVNTKRVGKGSNISHYRKANLDKIKVIQTAMYDFVNGIPRTRAYTKATLVYFDEMVKNEEFKKQLDFLGGFNKC